MSDGISINVSEFQAALKEYLRFTSKLMPVALNGKAKDLALRAAQNTPKSVMTNAEHTARKKSFAFVTFKTKEKHGPGFTRAQRREEFERLQKTRLGKGFMKSGFVKASKLFRNTKDASKAAPQNATGFDLSRATAKHATESSLAALFDIEWKGKGDKDASLKQAIVSPAIAKAVAFVTADMRAYILRKMEQQAKKNSASTVRAIAGAFR